MYRLHPLCGGALSMLIIGLTDLRICRILDSGRHFWYYPPRGAILDLLPPFLSPVLSPMLRVSPTTPPIFVAYCGQVILLFFRVHMILT